MNLNIPLLLYDLYQSKLEEIKDVNELIERIKIILLRLKRDFDQNGITILEANDQEDLISFIEAYL